jgi:hypothetical protein
MALPLLVTFLVLAVIGQALNFFISIQIEQHVFEAAGVLSFFVLLPVVFITAWKIAVRLTEPADSRPALDQGNV